MSYLFLVAGTAPGATVLLQCCPHLTGLDGPFFMLLTSGAFSRPKSPAMRWCA